MACVVVGPVRALTVSQAIFNDSNECDRLPCRNTSPAYELKFSVLSHPEASVRTFTTWKQKKNASSRREICKNRSNRVPSCANSRANVSSFRLSCSGSNIASTEQFATGGDNGGGGSGGGGGGGGGGDGEEEGEEDGEKNRKEALAALAGLGRSLDSLPKDLAGAISAGKIPALVVERFAKLENAPLIGWLMKFGGFKERLLADDLFLTKVAIECGVGIFTKTAAEYEKRREMFFKEIDFVIADIIMAILADFMLVWLPAPTVGLSPALAKSASGFTKFLAACPDNAFQVPLRGTYYSLLQRSACIALGTAATNVLSSFRSPGASEHLEAAEETKVPILATSLAYGAYMAVSSNLRYQILAGVIEQRMLEPVLHNQKLALSVLSFAVRTGNTFLGSLLWVDYARFIGVQ